MKALPFSMRDDAVYFVPLGGCGHFGANMSLYGHRGQWIMVDCGMGFADDTMPGVEILLPDPSFAESLGDRLLGIVITHAHEDHIGALSSLWPRIKLPIYATPFTLERIRQKMNEKSWGHSVPLREVAMGGELSLGPFQIDFIDAAHSIPEAQMLALHVEGVGTLLHTGDWKIDPEPVIGCKTDEAKLRALGDHGVLALVGNSTNAMVPGRTGQEKTVEDALCRLMEGAVGKRVLLTCFATNVGRLLSVHHAAQLYGRQVCLVGHSLIKIEKAARRAGYLSEVPQFLHAMEDELPPADRLVFVCTGSQGEPRAALSRISSDDHRVVSVGDGDIVVFSSRAVPGNEKAIDRIKNRLYAIGAQVVTRFEAPIHVSGHAYRDEHKDLYAWTRPRYAVPIHGEQMQMEKHAQLAKECGVAKTLIPANGQVIEIAADRLSVVDTVPSGMLALEGGRIVPIEHEAILTRKRMMWNGSAVITAVVTAKGALAAPPKISALGLLDEDSAADQSIITAVAAEIEAAVQQTDAQTRKDDDALAELIRITARRFFNQHFGRKPQTRVHLVRI